MSSQKEPEMNIGQELTNRREFITATAAGATLATLAASDAVGAEVSPAMKEHEKANLELVNEFCASWESMDVDKITSYLDDKLTFRMIEGMPRVEGKAAMAEAMKGFLATRSKARFEVMRSAAMGNLVINERIDHFTREDGEDAFHVTGFFFVNNGKVVEWQDYTMPKP
jgi:limonene-1,2-epoxide hydrolase